MSGVQNPTENRPVVFCSQSASLGGYFHQASEPNKKQVNHSTQTAPSMPSPPLSALHLWLSPKGPIAITQSKQSQVSEYACNGIVFVKAKWL